VKLKWYKEGFVCLQINCSFVCIRSYCTHDNIVHSALHTRPYCTQCTHKI